MKPIRLTLAVALVSGLALSAYAQGQSPGHGGMGMGMGTGMGNMDASRMQSMMQSMMPNPNDPPSTKDYKEAHRSMMEGVHVKLTGDPDVDFRVQMIPHHQGAIDMAKVALKHARDAETKAMAQKMIDDQGKEIAEMQAWLKKHGK